MDQVVKHPIFWNGVELNSEDEVAAALREHAAYARPTLDELRGELQHNGALPEDGEPDPIARAIDRTFARWHRKLVRMGTCACGCGSIMPCGQL